MYLSYACHITDVGNKYKMKWNTTNALDFWKFRCSNHGIILLYKFASLWFVVVSASMCLSIAMQCAEIVPTPTIITSDNDPFTYSYSRIILVTNHLKLCCDRLAVLGWEYNYTIQIKLQSIVHVAALIFTCSYYNFFLPDYSAHLLVSSPFTHCCSFWKRWWWY